MQHPDEGMIHTWLDGELPVEEAAALEGHAAECEQCRAAIAEARGFIAASSRIVSSLDAVPAGVIPVARPVNRVWYSSPQFRAAAAVLVVAGASLLIMRTGTQKATLAVSTRADAIDAATAGSAERAMSRTAQSSVPEVASTPPVLADQAAAKVQAVMPAEPAPAKGFSILNAPVQQPVAANRVAANRVGANRVGANRDAARKEDFSGKGVKGGATSGVINEAARLDTGATISGPAMKAADALSSPTDQRLAKANLKVIRVDGTATTKKTIYQSLSGSEVVLTEVEPGPVLSPMTVTGEASRQRAASSAPASPPPVANSPVANSPVASAPVAQKAMAVHTISWIDPSTRRRYSLSGPVSVEELEAIKARLLQAKR